MRRIWYLWQREKEVLTLEEHLKAVEKEIDECSVRAKELNKQRKHIKDQIAEENKKKLYDAVVKSGLSVGQCIEIIDDYILNDTKSE